MSFNNMIEKLASDLNSDPTKKADLVKFPTMLDFDSSRTIIETVKAMQPGDYRMIAAVVVDRMRFGLDFVYAEKLETVQGSIIRISENSMPQTAADLSSILSGYCLAKDQRGQLDITISSKSNAEFCHPFKCEGKIFEQINVADCVPISFTQSNKLAAEKARIEEEAKKQAEKAARYAAEEKTVEEERIRIENERIEITEERIKIIAEIADMEEVILKFKSDIGALHTELEVENEARYGINEELCE